MENIYTKVTKALDEKVLGCKVQKIKRTLNENISVSYIVHPSIPRGSGDDDFRYLEHEVQVDIWSKYEVSNHVIIEKAINLMKENGFGLISIRSDLYEEETNIVHKPILFSYLEKIKKEGL